MTKYGLPLRVAVCVMAAGCASSPTLPASVDLNRSAIVQSAAEPALLLDGPSGKGSGAGIGGAKGAGIGLLIGSLACIGTGPFAALCIATVVPATTGIGAVSGAVVGAVRAEDSSDVATKRSLLHSEMAASSSPLLAIHLQRKLRDAMSIELPLRVGGRAASADPPEWTIQIAVTEVATLATGPDVPYALQMTASLEVLAVSEAKPVFARSYRAASLAPMTTIQWSAHGAQELHRAMDDMSASLADKMVLDLKRRGAEQQGG